jgi:hypothetical protein
MWCGVDNYGLITINKILALQILCTFFVILNVFLLFTVVM